MSLTNINRMVPGKTEQVLCLPLRELVNAPEVDSANRSSDNRQYFFIREGGGKVLVDSHQFDMVVGTFLVIPANCSYSFDWLPETEGLYFSSSELFLRTSVAESVLRTPSYFWDSYYTPYAYHEWEGNEQREKRERLFEELTSVSERFGQGYDEMLMVYVLLILAEDSMHFRLSKGASPLHLKTDDTETLYRFQVLLENHFRQHYTVDDYCRILGVSRSRLKEICKYFSGCTPLQLVQKRMIMEAKRQLQSSSKAINQIAFELGFVDAGYFSRFFKKHAGLAPANFRRLARHSTRH